MAAVSQSFDSMITALLRVLSHAKVKFIRYFVLDIGGNVRCKIIPVDFLRKGKKNRVFLNGVAFVKVCIGGFPNYADEILFDSGHTATGTVYLRPDVSTLRILPYVPDSAIVFGTLHNANIAHSTTSNLCCRSLLQRIVDQAKTNHQISFTVGVELEFILFDAKTDLPIDHSLFASVTLLDENHTFVSSLYDALIAQEISIELLHSESTIGQMELVLEYCDSPVEMADNVVLARQTIIAVAHQYNMKAIFLPKVYENQAGNGCHIHLSLQDVANGSNAFSAQTDDAIVNNRNHENYNGDVMSLMGKQFVEGILTHLPSIMAFTIPTTNSFRRVGHGCWTGSDAIWAIDDKNAPIRIVLDDHTSARKNCRLEYKLIDSTANIYLALSAILIAGLDGIINKFNLRQALSNKTQDGVAETLPLTITESLNLLEANEVLNHQIPAELMQGYLAIRNSEAQHAISLLLDDELRIALERA